MKDVGAEQAVGVIDKALELLGPNGERWIKGKLRTKDGFCIIGAMKRARSLTKLRSGNAEDFLTMVIKREQHKSTAPSFLISSFNDKPETTFENIREIMLVAKCEAMRAERAMGAIDSAKAEAAQNSLIVVAALGHGVHEAMRALDQ
jgi:hypothetical protein